MESGGPSAAERLRAAVDGAVDWVDFYSRLGSSEVFRNEVRGRSPAVLPAPDVEMLSGAAVDSRLRDFEAACVPAKVNAAVKTPRGWSYCPLGTPGGVVELAEARAAIEHGTLIYPEVQFLCPLVADAALAAQRSFGFPANANVYRTPAGRAESSPAHTDHHDVFVIQTQGRKRWRVWAPPPRPAGKDPLLRGKKPDDPLHVSQLGAPVLDTVLSQREVLYVPTGFPHFVQTDLSGALEDSVHVTLALGSHEHELTFLSARRLVLGGANAYFDVSRITDETWWRLIEPLPFGFLGTQDFDPARVGEEVRVRMREAEPWRFAEGGLEGLPCEAVCSELKAERDRVLANHERLYSIAVASIGAKGEELARRHGEIAALEIAAEAQDQDLYYRCRDIREACPPPPPGERDPDAEFSGRGRGRGKGHNVERDGADTGG
eukprot:Hpha_TRINITY_DN19941_c0_g1::TRINITY_DN19941_c0_g1_i1::g.93607::m.93607